MAVYQALFIWFCVSLYPDHDSMKKIVKSCKILEKVELSLGNLYDCDF